MRAIMVMFDSLNRHMLPPYGSDEIVAPNFERLAAHSVVFDRFYAGSMPCMPARRELHTGRYNFLHRSWGPLEPWDDSMPEMLGRNGVHTHLVSDHPHYWEDGGATYHPRYTTWEFFRGQEGDPWKGRARDADEAPVHGFKDRLRRQDAINRGYLRREADHPQTRTFDAGLEFIDVNADTDRWFLQIECFDPHEPFFAYDEYRRLYPHDFRDRPFDWPPYAKVTEADLEVEHARNEYRALVSMCDRSLGRVLDAMDAHDMWDDTLLIVNTDHGFLLGEHGWWAKSVQPWFDELVHLPVFLWDPRTHRADVRDGRLAQTIDIAPTLLDYFGVAATADMQGVPITRPEDAGRDAALFGIHGGHVNVTDGRHVYMRACATPDNAPLEEYTLMPTHMRSRFAPEELAELELADPFTFTKGIRPLRMPGHSMLNPYTFGTLLFDLQTDPRQEHPLDDPDVELRMLRLLARQLHENDAPASQFERLGLPATGEPGPGHLLVAAQRAQAEAAARPLPPLSAFASGRFDLSTPIPELLADPQALQVLQRFVPQLTHSEVLGVLGTVGLYELASMAPLPDALLHTLADALAAL